MGKLMTQLMMQHSQLKAVVWAVRDYVRTSSGNGRLGSILSIIIYAVYLAQHVVAVASREIEDDLPYAQLVCPGLFVVGYQAHDSDFALASDHSDLGS
eukprot:4145054-Amphidinium_carterae.3